MTDVVIYTSATCGYCYAALALLQAKGVAYEKVDVTGDRQARAALRERTGRHTVPQVFVGGRSVGGFTELLALERRGELDTMLGRSG